MDPQLVEAHKAYLRAYRELNKEKFHESYTKYVGTAKKKGLFLTRLQKTGLVLTPVFLKKGPCF